MPHFSLQPGRKLALWPCRGGPGPLKLAIASRTLFLSGVPALLLSCHGFGPLLPTQLGALRGLTAFPLPAEGQAV